MAIFNTTEKRREGHDGLDKWAACLKRHSAEQERYGDGFVMSCDPYFAWMVFFARQVGRGRAEQLKAVNDWVNLRFVYVHDRRKRGQRDYWQSPRESLSAGGGDCEDFAILKFFTLRMLGWTDVRLVVVTTEGKAHAVCVTFLKGKWLVLDNLMTLIYEDRRLHDYRPTFSMDETGWWRHRRKRAA